eukprot:14619320-Alexandrium_andersonii.AAC.1
MGALRAPMAPLYWFPKLVSREREQKGECGAAGGWSASSSPSPASCARSVPSVTSASAHLNCLCCCRCGCARDFAEVRSTLRSS